jgi:hypothetical protein
MSRSRSGSVAVAVVASLGVAPVVFGPQAASAMDGGRASVSKQDKSKTKEARSRSTSPVRDSSRPRPEGGADRSAETDPDGSKLRTAIKVLNGLATPPAGFAAFEPLEQVFDLHPQIKALPRELITVTEALDEVWAGGKGSTATVGAVVDGLPIPGEPDKLPGEKTKHGRVPQVLTVTHNGQDVTVTRPQLDGETADAPPVSFRFTTAWDRPAGWVQVFPQVRAAATLATPRLQYFYPQAITRGNLPFLAGFSGNDYKMLLVRDRQIRGDAEGAINAFADLLPQVGVTLNSLERYFPGSKVQRTTLEDLQAQLLAGSDGHPTIHGILSAVRRYTVETRRGKLVLYSNELDGDAVPVSKVAADLAKYDTETVNFLPTSGPAVIPAHPRPRLGEYDGGRWIPLPVIHEDAFTRATEALQSPGTLRPGEKIVIQGTLTRNVPHTNEDGTLSYAALGQPQARGTRVQWALEPLPAQPGGEPQVRIATRWNLTDYVNPSFNKWTPAGTKTIPVSQLTAEGRTYPTGNTYIGIN